MFTFRSLTPIPVPRALRHGSTVREIARPECREGCVIA
jgi:hypothetical protein